MRLHSERLHVEKSANIVEQAFTIKATAKAFGILSSGLYSDKILAILRELSCNAWDAHVAAKNTATPFEIKLPTSLDPTFYVKDFGVGLSHDEVINLYTTYFDSSKSDSNDYIGALGLGSKSPFSYVSSFSVESRYNETKRLYSAFIGENGVPSIALVGEEKTTEPNGMTISLGTKTGDAEKFRTAALKALMYFDPLPKVFGAGGNGQFKPHEIKHTVKGTNWKVREANYYAQMAGAYVVQGLVPYPIDRESLKQNGLGNLGYSILGLDVDFEVPIGDVEVAASREALSYTKATIANLIKVTNVAAAEMRTSIQKEFDACKSLWEARLLAVKFASRHNKIRELYRELDRSQAFTYKGKKIVTEVTLDMSKIKNMQLSLSYQSSYNRGKVKSHRSSGWNPTDIAKTYQFEVHDGMTVLVDDVYGSAGILGEYLTNNKVQNSNTYVLVIKGTAKKSYDQTEVDAIVKQLGGCPFQFVSALPYTKAKTKYAYRARKNDQALLWLGYPKNGGYNRDKLRRVFSRLCWNGITADPTDTKTEHFYVELERFSIVRNGRAQEAFDVYLDIMVELGILPKPIKIVGLNEKQCLLVKKNKAWNNVFTYCDEKFAEMNKTNTLLHTVVAYQVLQTIGNGIARHIVMNWPAISKDVDAGEFKQVLNDISSVYEAQKSVKYTAQSILNVAEHADTTFAKTVKVERDTLVNAFEKMLTKHAMLKLVDWARVSANDVTMIVEYANFIATQ